MPADCSTKEQTTQTPILELRNVSHTYQARKDEIEAIEIQSGCFPHEFLCVLGPPGRKSTILGLLAGFFQPAEGLALMEGEPILRPIASAEWSFQAKRHCIHG